MTNKSNMPGLISLIALMLFILLLVYGSLGALVVVLFQKGFIFLGIFAALLVLSPFPIAVANKLFSGVVWVASKALGEKQSGQPY